MEATVSSSHDDTSASGTAAIVPGCTRSTSPYSRPFLAERDRVGEITGEEVASANSHRSHPICISLPCEPVTRHLRGPNSTGRPVGVEDLPHPSEPPRRQRLASAHVANAHDEHEHAYKSSASTGVEPKSKHGRPGILTRTVRRRP